MRWIRLAAGVLVVAAAVGFTGAPSGAAAEPPVGVVQWRGHLGHGIVTDCDLETQEPCHGWVVIASRETLRFLDRADSRSGLFVIAYDVTWHDGVPSETYVSEGFLDSAPVDIPHNIAWGTASGTVALERCETVCTPTGESVTVDLRWTAIDKAGRYRDTFTFSDAGGWYSAKNWGAARPADLDATVNGQHVATVMPPFGEAPALDNDASVEVCLRCGLEPPL